MRLLEKKKRRGGGEECILQIVESVLLLFGDLKIPL